MEERRERLTRLWPIAKFDLSMRELLARSLHAARGQNNQTTVHACICCRDKIKIFELCIVKCKLLLLGVGF